MINYETKKLSNGLRTILIPMKQTNAVTVLLLVKTGSRYESKKLGGISHFLEHMFFKGTIKRPDNMAIANELDSIGASYNAFTSEEYTGFYIRCAKTKFPIAIEILGDIIENSQFAEAEIIKEKGVISEEINMYEDLPQKQISDLTKEHFYGDTPLGRSTLGTKQNVRSFKRSDFVSYKEKHYTAKNSVLVLSGSGNIKDWQDMILRHFGKFSAEKSPDFVKVRNLNKRTSVSIKYKKTDQTHLTLGMLSFARNNSNRYALRLINNIFGETMSSRLFTEVREKRGLAYYVGSDTWYFEDTGALIAYAGVDTKRVYEAIKVMVSEINRIAKKTITAAELKKAKDNIEGKMFLGLEDSFSVAEYFAEQELLYNEILKPEEIMAKIKKVTLDEVNNLAKKIINENKLKLTIIGPYKSERHFINLMEERNL